MLYIMTICYNNDIVCVLYVFCIITIGMDEQSVYHFSCCWERVTSQPNNTLY
jgi:hypothetical protein